MQHNGTLITANGTDANLPRITLADAVTQRVKWVWAIPPRWSAIALRFAHINEVATAGNIRFQLDFKNIHLGNGDVTGAVDFTFAFTVTALGQFDWGYGLSPATLETIPITLGGLGDAPFMLFSLSRIGGAGADTLAGGVSIGVVTATRCDPAA
jgi:hypothetical protein